MFDSIFRQGEKRRSVAVMFMVRDVRFQRVDYFIPHSMYCIYQEKDPAQKVFSQKELSALSDTKLIPINDTLKFQASLFEVKNDQGKFVGKKRKFMVRQISTIDGQEAYKDIGYFHLILDSLVQGPRTVEYSFDIIDDLNLLSGEVIATIRYRFQNELQSSSSSNNLLRKNSSVRFDSSMFEDWSDDEEEHKEDIADAVGRRPTNMSRQISGHQELPSLNRVNSVSPRPENAPVAPFALSARATVREGGGAGGSSNPPTLQRKVTTESIASIGFTSSGQMVDAREAPSASPVVSRYGTMQPHNTSTASMQSTGSQGSHSPQQQQQSSSNSPVVGLSHTQLAERTLSLDSFSSGGGRAYPAVQQQGIAEEEKEPQVAIQLHRSSSANSLGSTAKSISVKSVRFDDDVMYGGAGGGSRGSTSSSSSKQRSSFLAEEEDFGVTYEELEDCY